VIEPAQVGDELSSEFKHKLEINILGPLGESQP
jgi:hypothetical protein